MSTNDKERDRGGFFDIVAGELTNCIIRKIYAEGNGDGQIEGYVNYNGDKVIFTVSYWISISLAQREALWQFETTFQGEYEEFEEDTDQFMIDVVNEYIPLNNLKDFDEACISGDAPDVHITHHR